ncbi:hypothetical protein GCM10011511_18590 [Puia dinghuensis]|uniref:Ig-like domain-containing protein n=2 Tax=Puia dinghuensis TaxID=1792502 RepID=A0A8J2UBR2_9BACT|nr:hypothetical protein GCM10011511_18590 [Puia dinghuensis]
MTAGNTGPLTCSNTSVSLLVPFGSDTGITISWTGPNGYTSTDAFPTVSVPGTYAMVVTYTATGCSTSNPTTVVQDITAPASVSASNNGPLTCSTTSVGLSGSSSTASGVTYAWTGPSSYTATGASAIATVAGTYTLTATNTSTGCTSTASTTVSQNTIAPAGVTATASGILTCTNSSIACTANSSVAGANYGWTGPNGFTATSANTSVSAPGTYTVTATDPTNGCSSTAAAIVTQDTAHPTAITTSSVSANATLTCSTPNVVLTGSSSTSGVTYGWTGPNSFSASSASATVTAPGSYVLTVTNPNNGCSTAATANAVTQNIAVPLGVTANVSNKISCFTTSVTITGNSATSGATYAWTGPGGFTSAAQSASATLGGVYNLTVTNPADGCTATKQLTVVADTATPAGVTATNSGPITCTVSTVTLTGNSTTSNVTYSWSGPNGFFDPEQVSTTATDSGTYVLTVTSSGNGCSTNASTYVSANLTGCSSVARALTTGKAATFAQGGQDPQTATAFTYKVYPNPVSTVAYVEFQSPSRSQVSVELYNSLGVREQVLFQNTVEANQSYKLTLGPGGLGAGIHYCMIRVDGKVYTSKVLVMPGH